MISNLWSLVCKWTISVPISLIQSFFLLLFASGICVLCSVISLFIYILTHCENLLQEEVWETQFERRCWRLQTDIYMYVCGNAAPSFSPWQMQMGPLSDFHL